MSTNFPSKWNVVQDEMQVDCRIFQVHKRKMVRESDLKAGEFYVIDSNDWVNVLALTSDQKIVLVRQFRYGNEQYSLEPPGGVIEKGEDPVEGGLRELMEETGYSGKDPKLIGSVFPNSAIMSNRCHFVILRNVEKHNPVSFDPNEELETILVPVSELSELIRSGEISHSIALNAILHLRMELDG